MQDWQRFCLDSLNRVPILVCYSLYIEWIQKVILIGDLMKCKANAKVAAKAKVTANTKVAANA